MSIVARFCSKTEKEHWTGVKRNSSSSQRNCSYGTDFLLDSRKISFEVLWLLWCGLSWRAGFEDIDNGICLLCWWHVDQLGKQITTDTYYTQLCENWIHLICFSSSRSIVVEENHCWVEFQACNNSHLWGHSSMHCDESVRGSPQSDKTHWPQASLCPPLHHKSYCQGDLPTSKMVPTDWPSLQTSPLRGISSNIGDIQEGIVLQSLSDRHDDKAMWMLLCCVNRALCFFVLSKKK